MAQKDDIEIVKQFIRNLQNDGIINFACLYESFACNEATANSDIDVMLVFDMSDTDDDYILSKPWLQNIEIISGLNPFQLAPNDFNPTMFHQ